jgi:hypothetical protein
VAYRRADDAVVISANMPEAKTWWRNFLGNGGPVTLQLDGAERVGHAVAQQDEKGRVIVTVRLTNWPASRNLNAHRSFETAALARRIPCRMVGWHWSSPR